MYDVAYWKKIFSNDVPSSNIRLDFNRQINNIKETDNIKMKLDSSLSEKINNLIENDSFLLYTTLMAILSISIYRYTNNSRIIIGSPLLKEDYTYKINEILPIVFDVNKMLTFRQYLLNVRNNIIEVYKHQDDFLDYIRSELEKGKNNENSLFNIVLILRNIHYKKPTKINDDINISFTKFDKQIIGNIIYNKNLFLRKSIERFAHSYIHILEVALEDTNTLLGDLLKLSNDEKEEIIIDYNNTRLNFPMNTVCVHCLFEEQAAKNPNTLAVVYNGEQLTYGELNQRANKLAYHLKKLNIGPDILVGVFMTRSLEMIVSLLAVLKAGGAYVPLDPTYPRDRIISMLATVNLPVILTKESLLGRLPDNNSKVICLDEAWEWSEENLENPQCDVTENNLAYIIFTSGSTGVSKAAAVLHKGWNNLLYSLSTQFDINDMDKVLIISSFNFDITQRSIMMPLINGGELHLLASEYYDPDLVIQTICDEQISLLNCSPSTFYPLVESKGEDCYEKIGSLRCLFLGGESISATRLMKWATSELCNAMIINVYGAAECSDISTVYELKDFQKYARSSVPIGKPIYNTQVYILDNNLDPVPSGAIGEICLSGNGVGKGYINDKELTSKKFITNPFSDKQNDLRLYKTGDLGRYLPDGNIEFIGRVDYQVKIRGFRIELGDIESVIRQHPLVKEIIIIDKVVELDDHRLIAYLVPEHNDNIEPDKIINEVRQHTKEKLPQYMVPNNFIILGKLPLNPNGKIDRAALRSMYICENNLLDQFSEVPILPLEKELMDIFCKILNINKIGIDDNFFEMGGHSLLVAQVIATINQKFNIAFTTVVLYNNPTIIEIAKCIIHEIKSQ
ncbi:non-ribosomal peptide synthetase [Pelosinus fermentans]|uniref:Amino acid adenylation domain protein n=1 Tax=Pelosinus fermentans B4 TaxID=1149862 RepID=I9AUM8_9FIRM|nr:non-ribosomal peptide synthetase [Pelosinus fermentans]EIW16652.1 amino acid adenylation domain protein [Pelosinus fermentans B4]EIW22859.1 amino acid adenylation domain protein [Pelosinus fermentans A11]